MGALPEFGTAAPGYTGVRPRSTATIARVLQCNGYATGAFGKMHQTPVDELGPAGSFEHWPTSEGFDRFYGFLGFDSDQFHPTLIDGVTPVDPPSAPEGGYHLSEDLVEKAMAWVETGSALDAERPWFCYLSFGACHAPLQVPEGWRDRYRGEFDHGWNAQRELTLARQKELGVVPADAELPAWPTEVPSWDELDDVQKKVAARFMEIYAAFAEHTDAQVQRLIDALEHLGQLENTIVVYLLGDNGAAAEAGITGTLNYTVFANGFTETAERMFARLDDIGSEYAFPGYPVGWALAMDAPYQWTKTVASHYGGTRNGLVVSWPKGLAGRAGELRNQWHHCIDFAPTILELIGLPAPILVDGASQKPLEGVSMAYTFDDPQAADRHTTQYFEVFGNRGIYEDGWTAVTKHHSPWAYGVPRPRFTEDVWELYDTSSDWTQARNVAAEYPEKLEELKQRFLVEAARYQVFPLDDRSAERMNPGPAGRRDPWAGRTSITLSSNMPGLRENIAPDVKNRSFVLTASIDVPASNADGVLVAQGGRFGGWSLYILDGRVCYCHNYCDVERMYVRSESALSAGRRTIRFRFDYDGGGSGKGGTGTIFVDEEPFGSGRIERTTPLLFSASETLDVGIDRGTPVTEEYGVGRANAFGGEVLSIRIDLGEDLTEPPLAERRAAALAQD